MAKSPTFGNVIFREGQYAVLGKVALYGKVVILGKIAFLGKVAADIIDSIVLVSLLVALALLPSLHPHCRQHCAGSSTSSRWRRCLRCNGVAPPCCAGVCPITLPLAMHGSTLRASLACLSCPAHPRHHVALLLSSTLAGPDMPNPLLVRKPCWLRQCTVVMHGRITVPSIVITVNGIVVVIYVGRRRCANCLVALDGLVCPGTTRH